MIFQRDAYRSDAIKGTVARDRPAEIISNFYGQFLSITLKPVPRSRGINRSCACRESLFLLYFFAVFRAFLACRSTKRYFRLPAQWSSNREL